MSGLQFLRKPVVIGVAIAILMCGGLYLEGRLWHCTCGGWQLWIADTQSRHCSQHFLDAYAFTHFLHGFLFLAALWPLKSRWSPVTRFLACLGIEALWELWENTPFVIDRYRTTTMALGYEGDSIVNSLGDLLACGVGYWVASKMSWRLAVAVFLAVEVVLLVTIRDSLLLNIIMLLFPLEFLKQWQLGT